MWLRCTPDARAPPCSPHARRACGCSRRYVHGFAYRGLKRFADSFDYSSECWKRFYAARDEEAAKRKAEEDAAAAAAQAQADAQAADRVGGTKVTAPGADARAEVGGGHGVLGARTRTVTVRG